VSAVWQSLFLVAAGAWAGGAAFGIGGISLMLRRLGIDRAWPAIRVWAPWLDLFGTWAGALSIVALAMGRRGFSPFWAGAMLCCALGVTAGLYGRAVLMPSLDAAFKRWRHEPDKADRQAEWMFLWRLATGTRALTLLLALGAIACVGALVW